MQLDDEIQVAEINNNLYDDHLERFDGPVIERPPPQHQVLNEVNVQADTAPTMLEQASREHEENNCSQTIWSAANSPDPEPVTEFCNDHAQQTQDKTHKVEEPVRSSAPSASQGEEDEDSFSHIPAHFLRSIAPLPPIQVDLPTRLHLTELDVERLNVREVVADRLIVSSVDTNSLQVNSPDILLK